MERKSNIKNKKYINKQIINENKNDNKPPKYFSTNNAKKIDKTEKISNNDKSLNT